jgi:hypothetical protein
MTTSEIARALNLLIWPGEVAELRVPDTPRRTVSGYFNDLERLAEAAARWSGQAPGVYVTLNPVNPDLLARAANRAMGYARHATADGDILCLRWLPVDFDPVRPAGVSSTHQEHRAALERARECREWLEGQGWPQPVYADSGNGAHLLYPVELPNDGASRELLKGCLEALAFRFNDERVVVDQTTYNAARIWKVYGTAVCKGDSLADRPHRRACILEEPWWLEPVSPALLQKLASLAPAPPSRQLQVREGFDLEGWIQEHQLPVVSRGAWKGGRRWVLNPCPWNPAHTNGAAYIVQFPSGAIAAGCHHNGCAGKDWFALRSLYEPEAYPQGAGQVDCPDGMGVVQNGNHGNHYGQQAAIAPPQWPGPPAKEAFYGPAGDIVRTIEPHSEADPVALLVNLLVAFGSVVGRRAYFVAEADRHYPNLYAVLVGETSKGRKGSSWGHIRGLLSLVDEEWAGERVQSGLSSGEGLIWAVRDPIERQEPITEGRGRQVSIVDYETVVTDPGVEDRRLTIVETEFASTLRILRREGNTLSATLRQAWDTGDLRTLTKNSPAKATGAHISILGHITREELLRYLEDTETANGFANRFLWVCVRRSKALPEGGNLQEAQLRPLAQRLARAVEAAEGVGEMRRDEEARKLWWEVYPELSEGKPGLLGAVISRAEAQVMRLACVYALLDCSPVVGEAHLRAALALWDYCEGSVRFIFGDRLGDPVADALLKALQEAPEGLTRTQISNLLGRNQSASRIAQALASLEGLGKVRRLKEESGGRPAERWAAV